MIQFEKNTKKQFTLSVSGTEMRIPVTAIYGNSPGETITISAGVHSREYIGVEALILLAQQIRPEEISGTILLLHCCNYDGFIQRSSDVIPGDGKNLNREFPGDPNGTIAQRMAAFLETEVIRKTDYLVDLHSGGFCESLTPHVYYHGAAAPEVCERSEKMASMTSVKYLVRSSAQNGFYSYAGQCGVPAIILERGGCGLVCEEEVQSDVADVKNILRGLGFLRDMPASVYDHIHMLTGFYEDAPCSGCWYPKKVPGDRISKGEVLGEIRSIYGDLLQSIPAKSNGAILYQTASLGIERNKAMIAYGVTNE